MRLFPRHPETLQLASAASAVFTVVPILWVLATVVIGPSAPLNTFACGLLISYAVAGLIDIGGYLVDLAKPSMT